MMCPKILKIAAISESLVHIHKEVNKLSNVRILVDFKTEIWSHLLETLFASLNKVKVRIQLGAIL
jgi:hypothetical protein